jgi:uncharacterized membrane protein
MSGPLHFFILRFKEVIDMANIAGLAEHHASVTVDAPVHQVYSLFTHFNDFPKFMSFVKEVTYYDNQRSHWVASVIGQHQWDVINEGWVEDQQIGWRATDGLENTGRVTFRPLGANQTQVDVFVNYNPPAGLLGDVGEKLGAGSRFENVLQHDLDNFARMVEQSPAGALDPASSNYLFQGDSAAAKGATTSRQDATMGNSIENSPSNPGAGGASTYTSDARSSLSPAATGSAEDALDRPILDQDIINEPPHTVSTDVRQQGTPSEQGAGSSEERDTRKS